MSSTQAPRRVSSVGHIGDVDGDEIHRHAADERHRIVAEIADRPCLAGRPRSGRGRSRRHSRPRWWRCARAAARVQRGAVADGVAGRHVAHLQDRPASRTTGCTGSPALVRAVRRRARCRAGRDRNGGAARARCRPELARLAGAGGNLARRALKALALRLVHRDGRARRRRRGGSSPARARRWPAGASRGERT